MPSPRPFSRRGLLRGAVAVAGVSLLPPAARADTPRELTLRAAPATAQLLPASNRATAVWAYDGQTPGPVLRFRQGERARIVFHNDLPQPTTVHWHGLRVPNAMDGVPGISQTPVPPGGRFVYEFDLEDAGSYWYHPHFRSAEQQDRGLHGALIVEEHSPIAVDRDLVWLLDDWRLDEQGTIVEDFGNRHDASHAGRLGNTATINGRAIERFAVRGNERVRLRLVNAANAWINALRFTGHSPVIIALDGQPVTPHRPAGDVVVVGPAQRVDVVVDMLAAPGSRHAVEDVHYPGREYTLVELEYASHPLREAPPDAPLALAPNPLPEPDPDSAERLMLDFAGGAMSRFQGGLLDGEQLDARAMVRRGRFWTVNGVAAGETHGEPLLRLVRGRSYRLHLHNDTAFPHPVHLHGQHFRVLSREGVAEPRRPWRDTVLLAAREHAEVLLVAHNPGHWLLHCHIPEHMDSGMSTVVEIA